MYSGNEQPLFSSSRLAVFLSDPKYRFVLKLPEDSPNAFLS